jgi:uncharacterized protein (DUF952 family)
MPLIYHITSRLEWEVAFKRGYYATSSLETEGFIHCCRKNQINGVLDRYFKDKTGIVLLFIHTEKLNCQVIYEWSPAGNDEFPHVYGPIITEAVSEVRTFDAYQGYIGFGENPFA